MLYITSKYIFYTNYSQIKMSHKSKADISKFNMKTRNLITESSHERQNSTKEKSTYNFSLYMQC